MTPEEKIKEMMELVDAYGDACETFGDYQFASNAMDCVIKRSEIEHKLRQMIKEDPPINWPEHAKYRAQDADGQYRFFKHKPSANEAFGEWIAIGGGKSCADAVPNWRETLVERPEQENAE